MKNIFMSIIIPTYNREKELSRCIESIIKQDMTNIEIIIIDDFSDDNTIELIKKYQMANIQISIQCNNKKEGAAFCRNRGLECAKGKYIWFVDSDDYIAEYAVSQLKSIITDEDILCFDIIHEKAGVTKQVTYQNVDCNLIMDGKKIFSQIVMNNSLRSGVVTQVYQREFLNKNGIRFEEGYICEDVYFPIYAMLNAKKVKYLPETLYTYDQSTVSVTTTSLEIETFKGEFLAWVSLMNYWDKAELDSVTGVCLAKIVAKEYRLMKRNFRLKDCGQIRNWVSTLCINQQQRYMFFETEYMGYWLSNIKEEMLDKLYQVKQCYIYGAGNVAEDAIFILQRLNIEIKGCLISKSNIYDPDRVCGIPVYEVKDRHICKNLVVLIATLPNYYSTIKEKLREEGFQNIISLL